MSIRRLGVLATLAAASILPSSAARKPKAEPSIPVEWRTLVEGVHLATARDAAPSGLNALVVEREDGLLVVDTLGTPARARALLRDAAARFRTPVRYLVLSHPHADAVGGASAFPDEVLIVAAADGAAALRDGTADLGGEARQRAEDPSSWAEPRRPRPVLLVSGPTTLDDARHRVDLFVPARGHSRGDLAVRLPESGVLAVGDLLAGDGNPYAVDGECSGWLAALNDLARTRPEIVVPLRGSATDQRGILVQRDAFAWLRGRIDQAYVDLIPSAKIPEKILSDPGLAERFDLEARPSFVPGLVECMLEAARVERRKRGYPD